MVTKFPLLFATALSLVQLARGAILTSPEQVAASKQYDFIIVGAGTAGCVIAARLTEDPSVKVLLIEAGVSDNGTQSDTISVPLLAGSGTGTMFDWNYTTTAQAGLNGRLIDYPRGFVLGGSSSINGMIYARGSSEEYDRLANVSGDAGWSWNNLKTYILKNERHTPAWNNRSNVGEYDPRVHGNGPLLTGLTPTVFEADKRVFQMTEDLPNQYPFNLDLNSGNGLGFGWLHTTVGDSARSTSASAYLHPALNSRSNLDLLLHTQVTRLVSTSGNHTFKGVQVAQSATAANYSFTAKKEAKGTTQLSSPLEASATPHLLMLSGIGPSQQLQSVGIPPILDLPDVGANLQDQSILTLQWAVNGTTLSSFFSDPAAFGAALGQYAVNKTGIAAGNTVVNTIGFLRWPNNSPMLTARDPAAGPNSPHFQFSFLETFYPNVGQVAPTTGNWLSVSVVVQSPTSHGSLNITSPSPFVHPTINPAFYTTLFDIRTAIHAIRTLISLLATPAWDGFILEPFPAVAALSTDDEIEAYIRTFADSLKHPTSTAKISKTTDTGGVVGPDLLVKGAKGLRIVDASVLPSAVAGFPQAEVYIVAERAADLIKSAWSLT
ncbi:aryl-alcohol oxidase-like protein [Mycena olivaceomarginata]|nr:aryl-alcohol oxidase-like protein [Mycena olivaceomarginata]